MTHPTQGNGGPDGRPLCWNGEPRDHYLANAGFGSDGAMRKKLIPWDFSRECKSWASHPGTDPVPLAEGWKCEGCAHYPEALVHDALLAALGRK